MNRPLILGLLAEGTTDLRFLSGVIARTFEEIIISQSNELPDIYPVEIIYPLPGDFIANIANAAQAAQNIGIMILCIHVDADSKSDKESFDNKILPAFKALDELQGEICRTLVPVIPVQMTEAWMLADLKLLKDEIMTDKSNELLQLTRMPENYADPKEAIKNAINIAQEEIPRRKKKYEIKIADLYLTMGQKINLSALRTLPSFRKFEESARAALLKLNYFTN